MPFLPVPARVEPSAIPVEPASPEPDRTRDDPCDGASAYGTCTGDVATACVGGRLVTVDCAHEHERCVMTREGASCLPRKGGGLDCSHTDVPVCDGNVLRHCVDGYWEGIDCAMRLSQCDATGTRARCVATAPESSAFDPLAASTADELETCDGKDEDSDGAIDEGGVCDTIALVAFVSPQAKLRNFEARMQRELEIANRVFHPLTFEWNRTVQSPIVRPSFHPDMFRLLTGPLSRAESNVGALGQPPSQAAAAEPATEKLDFYIPVLFVEAISTSPPKVGLATLPNARCGGVRTSDLPAPADGLIVLSEARQPETLAHELGHYLGLCHTHEELASFGIAGDDPGACEASGDGMCDTAFDPGPPTCAELETCDAHCEGVSAAPDTSNIMSYYMGCRQGLSAQQLAETERNLSLRRGWFRCLDSQDCPCMPGDPAACPVEMSCQPAQRGDGLGECILDGPAVPGAPCRYLNDCSGGSICLAASGGAASEPRCARACRNASTECACTDVGLPFLVCRQDLE